MPSQPIGLKLNKIIIVCGLLLILYATLFPFDFVFKDVLSFKEITSSFDLGFAKPDALGDFLRNISLFIFFSFGFTGLLQKRRLGRAAEIVIALTAGLGLSFTVEVLQVFLSTRDPSLADILANGIGTFLGFLLMCLWGVSILRYASALLEKSKAYLPFKTLMVAFLGYATLVFLISMLLQRSTNLSNWDPTFPLLLGNERTGDRPWRGYITNFYITDKVASDEEVAGAFADRGSIAAIEDSLVVSYKLTDGKIYHTEAGHPSELSWQGATPGLQGTQNERGVLLTANRWLETMAPAAFVTERLRETSQFTLNAIVATSNINQTGPARIISISNDPYHRNFTLGQEGSDLVLRLRTPVTGENGMLPELYVSDVFTDTNPHHLIITYDGAVLRLYVDGLQRTYSFELTPLGLFQFYLRPQYLWQIRLNAVGIEVYKMLYYGLVFIPLGIFLVLIAISANLPFVFRFLWACGGILLPAFILEVILVSESGRVVRLDNLLLSVSITVATMLLIKVWARSWWRGIYRGSYDSSYKRG